MKIEVHVENKYGHKWIEDWGFDEDMFCPNCGNKGVFIEEGCGDYYVGPEHI